MSDNKSETNAAADWIMGTISARSREIANLTAAMTPQEVAVVAAFLWGALEAQDPQFGALIEDVYEFILANYYEFLKEYLRSEEKKLDRNTIYFVVPSVDGSAPIIRPGEV